MEITENVESLKKDIESNNEPKQKKKRKPPIKVLIEIIEHLKKNTSSYAAKMSKKSELDMAATEITSGLRFLESAYSGLLHSEEKDIPVAERKNSKVGKFYSLADKKLAEKLLAEFKDIEAKKLAEKS
jgi:hypothetical protein